MNVQGRIVTTQIVTGNAHRTYIDKSTPYTGDYTVTPSEQAQTLQTSGKRMTENVTVEAVPWVRPQGNITITENGEHDVEAYQTATVQVPQGVFPSGTLNITENDTYDVTEYESAKVNITPSLTPILIDTFEITEPLEAGARYTIPLTSYDFTGYRVVWIELINFTLSVRDWLYVDDPWSLYFGREGTHRQIYNLKKVLMVSLDGGVVWRIMSVLNGFPVSGDPTGIEDVKLYAYSRATAIESGIINIWAY